MGGGAYCKLEVQVKNQLRQGRKRLHRAFIVNLYETYRETTIAQLVSKHFLSVGATEPRTSTATSAGEYLKRSQTVMLQFLLCFMYFNVLLKQHKKLQAIFDHFRVRKSYQPPNAANNYEYTGTSSAVYFSSCALFAEIKMALQVAIGFTWKEEIKYHAKFCLIFNNVRVKISVIARIC